MSRKMVVAIDEADLETKNQVTKILEIWGWQVWHWIEDLWLIAGVPDHVTPKILSEILIAHFNNSQLVIVVFEVQGTSSFWGKAHFQSWKWMETNWGPQSV